ncbi:tyrosine-type recombinase/integrase [Frateuria edaphi]|uniref:tyrosine-type recombinase/integrase n=1 Tax=Frateuria edaphi TaxID=2898793 RepID=UPI003CE57423
MTRSGHKSFAIEGRIDGRKVKHSFGRASVMAVEHARKRARSLLLGLLEGRDPTREAAASREAWTLQELADAYSESHLPKLRPASQAQYTSYLDRFILPELGRYRVRDVQTADVLRLFRLTETTSIASNRAGARRTTANRVLATLSSMFHEACLLGLRIDNPCRGVRRNPEVRRERYLSEAETARLLAACDASRHASVANLIRLLVFTGARRGETLSATWGEFDLQAGTWTKPSHHTKQNRIHSTPISPAAVALLRDMKGQAGAIGENDWLFPGRVPGERLASPKRAVSSIFRSANLSDDVTLHTLRHSFAARVVSAGHGLHAAGKLMGHTQAATTHRYAHLEHDAQRRALSDVDSAITKARSRLVPSSV